MRMMRLSALAVAGTLLGWVLPPAAQAGEATLNGVTFTLPDEGWQRQGKHGIELQRSFAPEGDRGKKGAALIQILPAATSGSFAQNYQLALGVLPDLLKEKPLRKQEGKTTNGYPIRMEHRCCARRQNVSISTRTVGVEGPDKQQFMVLVLLNLRGSDARAAEADFAAIVRSIRIAASDKPFALQPPKGAGGLEGVYTTLKTGLMPNAFGGLDFQADSEVLMLDPGGLFSRAIPSGTIQEHCAKTPEDCGTYRLTGGGIFAGPDRIEMSEVSDRFGIIETKDESFARSGDGLSIDGQAYTQVKPFDASKTFNGKWRYFYASSGSLAGSSGGVSVERLLELRPDGTFTRTGATGFSSSVETGSGTSSVAGAKERPLERGTYAVSGFHLTLKGADGRSERLSLFMPDRDKDDLLVIDGANYLKQDK